MKIRLLSITALVLLSSGNALAQLSCNPRDGRIGELACNDQEVKNLVHQVALEANRLGCAGLQRHELKVVENAWGGRQYQCGSSADIRTCVVSSLQSEVGYLQGMKTCEITSHPVKFDTTVPSYVLAHPKLFLGSEVLVNGEISLADCNPGATSVIGKVHEYEYKKGAIEIRFKSMPDAERSFLCKRPTSSWRGTVRLTDKGVAYLYATDVLGAELP